MLGTAPAAAPPHVFALDGEELRYASFHRSPQGWVFEASHRAFLPDELFGSGVLGAPMRDVRPFWELLSSFTAALPSPVKEASLVLPDDWLRLAFTESSPLPGGAASREAILRFKLSRLVPFRVEELRISATEVTPFPGQDEPLRLLLGFAIESLLTQLEDAFAGVSIELGQITNQTLSLLASLSEAVDEEELIALVMVERNFFSVSYLLRGEPLLYRYKAMGEGESENEGDASQEAGLPRSSAQDAELEAAAVRRDLRLTTNFIRRQLPDRPLARAFLAAPPEAEPLWLDYLADELEVAPVPLDREHLNLSRSQTEMSWQETAPLLGAASIEVV